MNGAWRLILWPPKLDPNPRFFTASAMEDWLSDRK
jgi:hypothetical protein